MMIIPTKQTYIKFHGSPLKISRYRDVLFNELRIYECDEEYGINDREVYFFTFRQYDYIYLLPIPFDKDKTYKGLIKEIDHGYESSSVMDDIKSGKGLKHLPNSSDSK